MIHILVPFLKLDVGEASEPVGRSSRSLPNSNYRGFQVLDFPPIIKMIQKKGETPLFNEPSGFRLWHNLSAVGNEAAA